MAAASAQEEGEVMVWEACQKHCTQRYRMQARVVDTLLKVTGVYVRVVGTLLNVTGVTL